MFIADETWELTHSVRSEMLIGESWSFSVPDQHGTPDGVPRYTVQRSINIAPLTGEYCSGELVVT